MAYSRDEIKQITDKVLNMCKADAVEVRFSGGERSATRFANSSITANLIEHDQEVTITVRYGQKTANATTHQFDDATLKTTIDAVQALARRKPDNPELMPLVKPPQNYIEVDAALPSAVNFGPAERAKMVKACTDICENAASSPPASSPSSTGWTRTRIAKACSLFPLRRTRASS
jgi:predicted Zn-dependent protease